GRPAYQDGAAAARAVGDAVRVARAALGFADRGLGVPHQAPDAAAVALLQEALGVVPPGDAPLRSRLLARLSVDLAGSRRRQHGEAMSADAVALARQIDDPAALAHALSARHFILWRWNFAGDRAGVAGEIIRLAATLGDADLEMQGRTWLVFDLAHAGEAS